MNDTQISSKLNFLNMVKNKENDSLKNDMAFKNLFFSFLVIYTPSQHAVERFFASLLFAASKLQFTGYA